MNICKRGVVMLIFLVLTLYVGDVRAGTPYDLTGSSILLAYNFTPLPAGPSLQPIIPSCGDGDVNAQEECDEGNAGDWDVLSASGSCPGGFACAAPGTLGECKCYRNMVCGDSHITKYIGGGGEECDTALDPSGCTLGDICNSTTCQCMQVMPICGNGEIDSGETCDPKNDPPAAGCGMFEYCTNQCECDKVTLMTEPVCGNGKVEQGESCDGSAAGCMMLPGTDVECTASCTCEYNHPPIQLAKCGNQQVDPNEECDYNAADPIASCQPQYGQSAVACSNQCNCEYGIMPPISAICGNGKIDPGEECGEVLPTGVILKCQNPNAMCLSCQCALPTSVCDYDGNPDPGEDCDLAGIDPMLVNGVPTNPAYINEVQKPEQCGQDGLSCEINCKCQYKQQLGACDNDGVYEPWNGEACDGLDLGVCKTIPNAMCNQNCECELPLPGICDNDNTWEAANNEQCDGTDLGLCKGIPGFTCDNCMCIPPKPGTCNNNNIWEDTNNEQCDGTDLGLCKGVPGFTCDNCVCIPPKPAVCGNDLMEASNNEQCDGTDLGLCAMLPGNWSCGGNCECVPPKPPVCNLNGVWEPGIGEQCDGSQLGNCINSTCNNNCECEPNKPLVCNHNNVQEDANGEECDGMDLGKCAPNMLCDLNCKCVQKGISICGNSIVEAGEQCDPQGSQCPAGLTCDANCQCAGGGGQQPFCGDGVVTIGQEECEPGVVWCLGQTVCDPNDCLCKVPPLGSCGDGVVDFMTEQCDPAAPKTGCAPIYQCSANCHCVTSATYQLCGNGNLNQGEECDFAASDPLASCTALPRPEKCESDCSCTYGSEPSIPTPPDQLENVLGEPRDDCFVYADSFSSEAAKVVIDGLNRRFRDATLREDDRYAEPEQWATIYCRFSRAAAPAEMLSEGIALDLSGTALPDSSDNLRPYMLVLESGSQPLSLGEYSTFEIVTEPLMVLPLSDTPAAQFAKAAILPDLSESSEFASLIPLTPESVSNAGGLQSINGVLEHQALAVIPGRPYAIDTASGGSVQLEASANQGPTGTASVVHVTRMMLQPSGTPFTAVEGYEERKPIEELQLDLEKDLEMLASRRQGEAPLVSDQLSTDAWWRPLNYRGRFIQSQYVPKGQTMTLPEQRTVTVLGVMPTVGAQGSGCNCRLGQTNRYEGLIAQFVLGGLIGMLVLTALRRNAKRKSKE